VDGLAVEAAAQVAGNLAMAGGLVGLFVHYLRFGPKIVEEGKEEIREGKEP